MPTTSYPFDQYEFYRRGVQSPDTDAVWFKNICREHTNKDLVTLGEDFCGTLAISCEWVKLDAQHKSVAVDLSEEPITYGKTNYLPRLSADEQSRVQVINSNVLSSELPKVDCIVAMNFSYFIFKTRAQLRSYFENCHRRLPAGGLLISDCFGGPDSQQSLEAETEVGDDFSVFWDQEWFDPINNLTQYHLHFQSKDGKKYERVFSYHWRMWSIAEIREIMIEAGFKKTFAYWETTDSEGNGSGEFVQVESTTEECDSWIANIVGQK